MAQKSTDKRGSAGGPTPGSNSLSVLQIARWTREQVSTMTGLEAESVSAVEKEGDVWRATVNLVELRRVPATTDVLATYEAVLDANGVVTSYHRLRRYLRGQIGEE